MVIEYTAHVYYGVATFPVGGERFWLADGSHFVLATGGGTRAEAMDGSRWEYRGISAYAADNRDRVKGWQPWQ